MISIGRQARLPESGWTPKGAQVEPQKKAKVSTSDLQVGMYVAHLDRPWTETPFLFQGFFIRNQDEIEELQRHCQFVYVDIEQSDKDVTHPKTGSDWDNRTITQVTSLR